MLNKAASQILRVFSIAAVMLVSFFAFTTAKANSEETIRSAIEWVTDQKAPNGNSWQVISNAEEIPTAIRQFKNPQDYALVVQPPSLNESEGLVTLYAWNAYNGILARWELTMLGENVTYVFAETVDMLVGSPSVVDWERYSPSPGETILNIKLESSLQTFQVGGPEIQVDNHWVEIYDTPNRTQSTRISVLGFEPNVDVNISIEVDGVIAADASGNPLLIHTDNNGTGTVLFTPAQNAPTGRAMIKATSPANPPTNPIILEITDSHSFEWYYPCTNLDNDTTDDERGGLTLERVKEGQAVASGSTVTFRVHYTDQNIVDFAEIDPERILQELIDAYEMQVGAWGFDAHTGTDYDADGIAHLYISDGDYDFHMDHGSNSFENDYCADPRGHDRRINLQANIRSFLENNGVEYSGTEDVIAHEHFHNIQFAYTGGHPKWAVPGDISDSFWYAEGMARFIETIMDTADSYNNDQLPSKFYWDVNYFTDYPDRPLNGFSYDYALFWGFLYQHNYGFEVLERVLQEIRTAGDEVEIDGPNAVTAALASVSGDHDSMIEAYRDFAAAVYTKDFNWAGSDRSKAGKRVYG